MLGDVIRPPLIFLDLDGVIIPSRAMVLPENLPVIAMNKAPASNEPPRRADPVAIALIDRLCVVTGARVVLMTNWIRRLGAMAARDFLLANGFPAEHFHEDWYTPIRFTSTKPTNISLWFQDHPDHNENEPVWIAIDDEPLFYDEDLCNRHVRPDGEIGISLVDYRIALHLLGKEDRDFLSIRPEPGLLEAALDLFPSADAAHRWIFTPNDRFRGLPPAFLRGDLSVKAGIDCIHKTLVGNI